MIEDSIVHYPVCCRFLVSKGSLLLATQDHTGQQQLLSLQAATSLLVSVVSLQMWMNAVYSSLPNMPIFVWYNQTAHKNCSSVLGLSCCTGNHRSEYGAVPGVFPPHAGWLHCHQVDFDCLV